MVDDKAMRTRWVCGCDGSLSYEYDEGLVELSLSIEPDGSVEWYGCERRHPYITDPNAQPDDYMAVVSETETKDGLMSLVAWMRARGIEVDGHVDGAGCCD